MISSSMTLYETPEYSVRLEYSEEFLILHLPEVKTFNTKVLRHMKAKLIEWNNLFKTLGQPYFWCAFSRHDSKLLKLMTVLGFKYAGERDKMFVFRFGEE